MRIFTFAAAGVYSTLRLCSLSPSPTLALSQWFLQSSPAPALVPALALARADARARAPSRPHLKQILKSQCPGTCILLLTSILLLTCIAADTNSQKSVPWYFYCMKS